MHLPARHVAERVPHVPDMNGPLSPKLVLATGAPLLPD